MIIHYQNQFKVQKTRYYDTHCVESQSMSMLQTPTIVCVSIVVRCSKRPMNDTMYRKSDMEFELSPMNDSGGY